MKKILLLAFGLGVAIWLNYQKSVDRALQKACDVGTMEACLDLGNRYRDRYRDGEGIPQDFARVASLYEQACKGGEMLACNNLGVRYHRGEGVVRDMDRAVASTNKLATAEQCRDASIWRTDTCPAGRETLPAQLSFTSKYATEE